MMPPTTHTDGREKNNNEVDNFLRHYRSPFPCYPSISPGYMFTVWPQYIQLPSKAFAV